MIDLDAASGRETLEYLRESYDAQVAAEIEQLRALDHLTELHRGLTHEGILAGADGLIEDARRNRERHIRVGADGTAPLAEWLTLEIAPLLGISPAAGALLLADVVNLRDRHPRLWDAVLAGQVRFWQAKQVTRRTAAADLSLLAARSIDEQLAPSISQLPWGRVLKLLDGLIVAADRSRPTSARSGIARSGSSAGQRRSPTASPRWSPGWESGMRSTSTPCSTGSLRSSPSRGDDDTTDVRRAKAFGVLATPARALSLLQSAVRPDLDEPADDTPSDRTLASCAGHTCGTIAVHPDRLLPKATLVVHVSDESLLSGTGVARVADGFPVPISRLHALLADSRVTVRPVLNAGRLPPVDSYEIPAPMRAAVLLRDGHEIFPFSSRRSTGLDLDHTQPYDHSPGAPPGQTREGNLGPLSRRAHRAKTHGGWRVKQRAPGSFEWTSPYGFSYLVGPHGTIAVRRAFHGHLRQDHGEHGEVA